MLTDIITEASVAASKGGPPDVVMQPDGSFGVEISGRPGLHLPATQAQKFMYALANGSMYDAQAILEEAASEAGTDVWNAWFGSNENANP